MKWNYWISQFTRTYCTAKGLQPSSIVAYEASLNQFHLHVTANDERAPDEVQPRDVLAYLEYLRKTRKNGDAAVNRHVVILRSFYRAMVAMGNLDHDANPMADFPRIKGVPRKLPVVLSEDETKRLLVTPRPDTVLGVRDRALLALLYGTGIRVSECATLSDQDVDLDEMTVTVLGKGNHQRTVPLNEQVAAALDVYRRARGTISPTRAFFQSRRKSSMSRAAIYERVRTWGARARIRKTVSPHRLRHTFATHLARAGVAIVTIRDLLGHRLITSTQVYLHVSGQELRSAAERHPIGRLAGIVAHLLPDIRLPFQHAPG